MAVLPVLRVASVKIRRRNIERSHTWFREVFALHEVLEWADDRGVLRGAALAGLGEVLLALREEPAAAAATKRFGFINVAVPDEIDLDTLRSPVATFRRIDTTPSPR